MKHLEFLDINELCEAIRLQKGFELIFCIEGEMHLLANPESIKNDNYIDISVFLISEGFGKTKKYTMSKFYSLIVQNIIKVYDRVEYVIQRKKKDEIRKVFLSTEMQAIFLITKYQRSPDLNSDYPIVARFLSYVFKEYKEKKEMLIDEFIAVFLYELGIKHSCSTFIDEDTIIAGYGDLNFDFTYPLPKEYIIKIYGTTSWHSRHLSEKESFEGLINEK